MNVLEETNKLIEEAKADLLEKGVSLDGPSNLDKSGNIVPFWMFFV